MSIEVRREDRVAILTINRPEALNALSSALLEELRSRSARCEVLAQRVRELEMGAMLPEDLAGPRRHGF